MSAHELMLRDFPLLLPEDASGASYHGFLTTRGADYRVRFTGAAPSDSQAGGGMRGAQLHAAPELRALLAAHDAGPMLKQRLARSASAHEFFVELRELIERLHRLGVPPDPAADGGGGSGGPAALSLDAAVYTRLVAEISEVGWGAVTRVEEGAGGELHLALGLRDAAGRGHTVSVALPAGYPAAPPRCAAALPAHVELSWGAGSALRDVIAQYTAAIAAYDEVWKELDVLDARGWVIEPEAPTRAALHRRLALSARCSLQVDLDHRNARAVPQIRFFGSEAAVAPLRASLNRSLHSWSLGRSVFDNLQELLGVTLPSAADAAAAKASAAAGEQGDSGQGAACAICYAYSLDGAIPAVVCDNAHCARPFHSACLLEWLRSLPDARSSFDTVFGTCPYCSEPITAKRT